MNETNNSALVPRAPGALEKAEPGAKRILSGMVADTLALAKKEPFGISRPLRIVVLNDEPIVLDMMRLIIPYSFESFKDAKLLLFQDSVKGWEELSLRNPDLLITDDMMPTLLGQEICERLLERKAGYPIIVMSGYDPEGLWVREYAIRGLNVKLLTVPFLVATFQKVVAASLNIPPDKNREQ